MGHSQDTYFHGELQESEEQRRRVRSFWYYYLLSSLFIVRECYTQVFRTDKNIKYEVQSFQ